MKPRMSQRIQFSLAYLLVAVVVLSFLQSWLLAPRTIEIPMSNHATPDTKELEGVLEMVKEAKEPISLQCTARKKRTGT